MNFLPKIEPDDEAKQLLNPIKGGVMYSYSVDSGMNVPVDNLLKTPQFWLLFSTATLLATGKL